MATLQLEWAYCEVLITLHVEMIFIDQLQKIEKKLQDKIRNK